MSVLERLMGSLAGVKTGLVKSRSVRRADRLALLLRTLISERGEATGAALARRSLLLYNSLDEEGRRHFFEILAREFSPEPDAVLAAAQSYHRDPSPANLARLQRVTEPPRQEVFRRMNMAPGGTGTLVGLRLALLNELKANPQLEVVDQDLRHLLGSWFNRGFLELRRIDWRTPAAILEKLIAYEAVHEIHGFPDLKRRLERDRRCFAFFHPALTDEPLIFVEVAFTNELPSAVAPILSLDSVVGDPKRAKCAVFYSITSCQDGLKGISFGNFLIKQVAADLHAELPNLRTFATLSPIPGLRRWVEKTADQALQWRDQAPRLALKNWLNNAQQAPADSEMQPLLESLAAHYLTRAWDHGHVLDPVARFHLGNGSRLERINSNADRSPKGLKQSFGLMVNYVYDLDDVERNHEDYVNKHRVVCSNAVERLAATLPVEVGSPAVSVPAQAA
jgi:malonyl-CoA decarboxylase